MALSDSILAASNTNLRQTVSFFTNAASGKTGKFSCGKNEAPGTGKGNDDNNSGCSCSWFWLWRVNVAQSLMKLQSVAASATL